MFKYMEDHATKKPANLEEAIASIEWFIYQTTAQ